MLKKISKNYTVNKHQYEQPSKIDVLDASINPSDVNNFVQELVTNKKDKFYRGLVKNIPAVDPKSSIPAGHTRFVCISDTHNYHHKIKIPPGDVLLHAGDFTNAGKRTEVEEFNDWLGKLPHRHKIVIAGNHELSFCPIKMESVRKAKETNALIRFDFLKEIPDDGWKKSALNNCTYLEDDEVAINGIRIYGSPWQPEFGSWGFNLNRGQEIKEKWDKIPDGIDILMTHGPPAGKLDQVAFGYHTGCIDLLNTIQLRVQPKYHVFGHIHEDPGFVTDGFIKYINAAMVDHSYCPVRKPIVFDFPNS